MAGPQDTGYLFSDIEGSTARWERDPERMRVLLERHDQIIADQVRGHGGLVVDKNGDGVFAIFQQGNPLECALAIQCAIQSEDWGTDPLQVRIGLHAGKSESSAADFRGVHTNRAARIMSLAWGGQTLLSDDAAAVFACPPSAKLRNLGRHRLKGVAVELSIYGLTHHSLRENEFPPLRSGAGGARPPPDHETPFFGRELELRELTRLLQSEATCLWSILGTGGCGKTRLASRLAELEGPRYPFGAHVVTLEAAAGADDVPVLVAQALRFNFFGGRTNGEQLVDYLRNKRGLLILDGVEPRHIDPGFITALLESCPELRLLATARGPLGCAGERIFRIDGLKPADDAQPDLRQSPAFRVFEYQAKIGQPDFRLNHQEEPLFKELLRLVDGSPLALELAARTCRLAPMAQIVARVRQSLDALEASDPTLPARHRGMRSVLAYTWEMLAPPEKRLLADLSVFPVEMSVEAAEAVTGGNLNSLLSLERHSMVKMRQSGQLELPPLVWQFARAKLVAEPFRRAELERRHAAYFLAQVPSDVRQVCGEQSQPLLDRTQRVLADLRLAWAHQASQGTLDEIRPHIEPLFHLLRQRGLFREAIAWFEKGLSPPGRTGAADALLLALIASCRIQLGDSANAALNATQAFKIAGADDLARAYAQHALGSTSHVRGDLAAARLHYGLAQSEWSRLGHDLGAYFTTASLAALARQIGDLDGALDLVQASRRIAVKLRYSSGVMAAFLIAGDLSRMKGLRKEALECYQRALALHDGNADPQMRLQVLRRLGNIATADENASLAELRLREALALACEIGDRRQEAECHVDIGTALLRTDRTKQAAAELIAALEMARELGLAPVLVRALAWLCQQKEKSGDRAGAELIAVSLQGRPKAEFGDAPEEVIRRIDSASFRRPQALETLADDLIGDHRYGELAQ